MAQHIYGCAIFHDDFTPQQIKPLNTMRSLVDRVQAVIAIEAFDGKISRVTVAT